MNTQTLAANEKGVVMDVLAGAIDMAGIALDVDKLKRRVQDAVEDTVHDSQRMAAHGKAAIADAVDDTTYFIKRNPWRSLVYGLGAGVGIGFMTGWLLTRTGRTRVMNGSNSEAPSGNF